MPFTYINTALISGLPHTVVQLDLASKAANSLVKWFMEKLGKIFEAMTSGAQPVEKMLDSIGGFMQYFGWAMLGVGIVLAIFEEVARYQQGCGNAGRFSVNIMKAVALNFTVFYAFPKLFTWALDTATTTMLQSGLAFSSAKGDWASDIATYGATGTLGVAGKAILSALTGAAFGATWKAFALVFLILLILIIKNCFSFLFDMAGKIVSAICLEGEGGLLSYQVARGNDSIVESYIQKALLLILAMLLEGFVFGAGMSMTVAGGEQLTKGIGQAVGYWVTGIALMRFSPSIAGIMGTAGGAPRPSAFSNAVSSFMGSAVAGARSFGTTASGMAQSSVSGSAGNVAG